MKDMNQSKTNLHVLAEQIAVKQGACRLQQHMIPRCFQQVASDARLNLNSALPL